MSNMYPWVDETRNFVGGRCPHRCKYCFVGKSRFPFVKKRYSFRLRLLHGEFDKPLGKDKTIFVCDCNDLFAEKIPSEWILKVLLFCNKYPGNTYLFQSKNPKRFNEFKKMFPKKTLLGTTIESNRECYVSSAPPIRNRFMNIRFLSEEFNVMLSIEPILDFDLNKFVNIIRKIKPIFVSVGADSKGCGLDSKGRGLIEPSKEKVLSLINELKKFTKVKIKKNLERITK